MKVDTISETPAKLHELNDRLRKNYAEKKHLLAKVQELKAEALTSVQLADRIMGDFDRDRPIGLTGG